MNELILVLAEAVTFAAGVWLGRVTMRRNVRDARGVIEIPPGTTFNVGVDGYRMRNISVRTFAVKTSQEKAMTGVSGGDQAA